MPDVAYVTVQKLCEVYFDWREISQRALPSDRQPGGTIIDIDPDLFERLVTDDLEPSDTSEPVRLAKRGLRRVEGAILAVSREMDRAFHTGGYAVPIIETGRPYIEKMCAYLTRCTLWDDNRPDYVVEECKRYETQLKQIAENKEDIPNAGKSDETLIVRDLEYVINYPLPGTEDFSDFDFR